MSKQQVLSCVCTDLSNNRTANYNEYDLYEFSAHTISCSSDVNNEMMANGMAVLAECGVVK